MIIKYRSYDLRINLLLDDVDDMDWELENDDNDQQIECLDTILHDHHNSEIINLIIDGVLDAINNGKKKLIP